MFFFVTQNNWRYKYKIILGYDFIQTNKVLMDIPNKQLIMGNEKFKFEEESPNASYNSNNLNKTSVKKFLARSANKVILEPNSFQIIQLSIPKSSHNQNKVILNPCKNKLKYKIQESLHDIDQGNIYTLVENNSDEKIVINKETKIGTLEKICEDELIDPSEKQFFQINNLSLEEIVELRQKELNENDFKLEHLKPADKTEILNILMKNSRVFSKSYQTLGSTDAVVPEFNLIHNFPIQTKPYPIANVAKNFAKKEIKNLLDSGIIEPSTSNYNFPVIFVKKKPFMDNPKDQKFRMVIDYRLLNSVTHSFKICLPKISDILHNISGKSLFSVLDLKSAFYQIRLRDQDKNKLAFCCELGSYNPVRLPFGSLNSTSYFHTLISKCLNDIKGPNIQFFLDDIIIAADSMKEMKFWLQEVFDRLTKFNLTLDPAKLQLCKSEITYLGFNVHKDGFSPSAENVNKILKLPVPKNVKQVQALLGMINYFRHLIFDFARIVQPIVNLTKKNTVFNWDDNCQEAFNTIQNILLKKPTLKNIIESETLYLVTDASKIAICGILMQKYNNKFFPVQFYSRQLTASETKYPSIRRELLGIYDSVKHFHQHLYGKSFIILTDAKPLTYHIKLEKQPEIVARWIMFLQQFQYKIEHISGIENPADYLSRVIQHDLAINNIHMFETNTNLSNEKIVQHQNNCKETLRIIQKLQLKDKFTCKKFYIDEESKLLMVNINPSKSPHKILKRIFIPRSLKIECLKSAHAPHFGIGKTYNFLKKKFSWFGMLKDTINFCSNCPTCLAVKPKSKLTTTTFIEKSNLEVGEMIAIDVVGKLPRSHDNKFFILTIVDHFSRFLEAIPLTNIRSTTIINTLNQYFARFGIPKILLTDNATNFTSYEFDEFLKSFNIQHRKSSIFYPQSNGTIERCHRIMKESLSAMCNSITEWSDRLLYFKLHYNSSKHSVTKFSPAEIFFGRNLNTPLNVNEQSLHAKNLSQYIKLLKNHIIETREMIKFNENEYFNTHKKYIKGRDIPNLEIGDKVFIEIPSTITTFSPRYDGPHTIKKILRNDNYIIEIKDQYRDLMKKYHVSKIFIQTPLNENLTDKENDNTTSN